MDDRAEQHRRRRKTRDRSLVLLLCGILLLMPPLASAFHVDGRVLGLPATLVYLFVVWALLILAAARLAPRLDQGDNGDDPA